MSGEIDVQNHHLNGSLPADIPDYLREFLLEVEDLSFEEVILQQASVYQSYQESVRNRVVATDEDHIIESSCSSDDDDDDDDDDDENDVDVDEDDVDVDDDDGEPSSHESVIPQESTDEAFARTLQEFGEEYDEYFIREFNGRASGLTESPMSTPSTQVASSDSSQDDVDPDNMRYEELLALGEAAGVENVGLSAAQRSRLPSSFYTSGMFSKNKEENCVVCQEHFTLWKRVIRLPCCHLYHYKCIIEWLKIKKNCPICQKEVV